VAISRSFSRAAEQMFITQPVLTRTVRQLESPLGADLTDRDTHPVSVTLAGQEFLPSATRILHHLDAGIAAVCEHTTVRPGFSWLLPDPWAQDTVTSFEDTTGDSVSLTRCDDPLAAIGEGRIDLALIRGEIADPRDARVVHLFDETRTAARSARYRPKRFHCGRTPGSVTPVPVRPAHSRSFAAGDTFLTGASPASSAQLKVHR